MNFPPVCSAPAYEDLDLSRRSRGLWRLICHKDDLKRLAPVSSEHAEVC